MVSGFIIDQLIVITEKELYNQKSKTIQYKSKFKLGTKIRDITKLEPGDILFIVTMELVNILELKH